MQCFHFVRCKIELEKKIYFYLPLAKPLCSTASGSSLALGRCQVNLSFTKMVAKAIGEQLVSNSSSCSSFPLKRFWLVQLHCARFPVLPFQSRSALVPTVWRIQQCCCLKRSEILAKKLRKLLETLSGEKRKKKHHILLLHSEVHLDGDAIFLPSISSRWILHIPSGCASCVQEHLGNNGALSTGPRRTQLLKSTNIVCLSSHYISLCHVVWDLLKEQIFHLKGSISPVKKKKKKDELRQNWSESPNVPS